MKAKSYTVDYILLLFVLAITGFMSFFSFKQAVFVIAPWILYLFFFLRKLKVPNSIYLTLGICTILFGLQAYVHHSSYSVIVTQTFRIYILALIAILVQTNFKTTYPRLLFFFCIISLVLWGTSQLFPGFKQLLVSLGQFLPEFRSSEFLESSSNPSASIYIYTINTSDSIRNSGPFWEPGMFAVFITLALIINLFNGVRLSNPQNVILCLADITTFSTAGYIALCILLIVYVFIYKKGFLLKLLMLIILPVTIDRIASLDFMQNKLTADLASTDVSYSRFGAMYYHWEKLQLSPLLGYGVNDWPPTAMDMFLPENSVSPNGITIVAMMWGIPIALLCFIFLYKSTYVYINSKSVIIHILAFIVLLAAIFSQDVTNREFFYMLILMGIMYKDYEPKTAK